MATGNAYSHTITEIRYLTAADERRMMKMSGRVTSCCVALFFALTSVSAVQKQLDSINDLKKIDFDQSVPKHSLLLLHWFANTVAINNYNTITLNFDPNSGDYGSHHYGNFEGLLDPLPWGYRYYTVGNINQETSMSLPSYVAHPQREYTGRNMDRIIIRVRGQNTGGRVLQTIDQVYITQHYATSEHQGTRYDPAHTYRITADLLTEIREFSVGENAQSLLHLRDRFGSHADAVQLNDIRNRWADLAALGLLLFIVIQEKSSSYKRNSRPENRRNHSDDGPSESKRNDSRARLIREEYAVIMPNEDHNARRMTENRGSGRYNTSGNLNERRPLWRICCIWFIALILLVIICVIIIVC